MSTSAAAELAPSILSARLTPEHIEELRSSGLSDETILAAQLYSLRTPAEVAAALGRKTWRPGGGGIAFPFFTPDGTPTGVRVKPDNPRVPTRKGKEGKPVKYDQRRKTPVAIYFPPRTRSDGRLEGDSVVLWTEGEKKALALDQLGYCTIGLTGVHNAHDVEARRAGQGLRLNPVLLAHVRIEGRDHVIAYDSDSATKPGVMLGAQRLAAMLLAAGASSVRMVAIPAEGEAKLGIDDFYALRGAEAVHELIRAAQPIEPAELRPEIVISTEEHVINAKAVAALANDPDVFQRGRALVRVLSARAANATGLDPEAPVIGELPKPILRERLSANVAWFKLKEVGDALELVSAHPPPWTVDAVHARGEWAGIRHLTGIVEQPTLRPDGTILDAPGYDEATGLLFLDTGVEWPKVPKNPTREDAQRALELLEDVVCDVPFEQPCHRSAWLASLLTLVARNAIPGPTPVTLVDATTRGAGKGLATDLIARIATGRRKPDDGFPKTDEEFDKRTTSWAMSGRQLVCFDNIIGTFGGESLCRVLTSECIGGRKLGSNEDPVLPWRTVIYATGNNVRLGPDMERRVLHVRLAPSEERPEERPRDQFRHPNIIEHVTKNRAALLCAALTVLRAYCVAGRPRQGLTAWGSYEAWSDLVREALVWAGQVDPGLCREGLRANADTKTEAHRALIAEWARLADAEGGPVSAKRAVELAFGEGGRWARLREVLEELATDKKGSVTASRLGYVLRGLRGRVLEVDGVGMSLASELDRKGIAEWTVTGRAGDETASPASPAHPRQHPRQQELAETRTETQGLGQFAGDAGDRTAILTRDEKACMHAFDSPDERPNHPRHPRHPRQVDPPRSGWWPTDYEPEPANDAPETDDEVIEGALVALRDPQYHGLPAGFLPRWSAEVLARAEALAAPMLRAELAALRSDGTDRRAALARVGRAVVDRIREELAA